MIYSNGPAVVLELPEHLPPANQPLIRPVPLALDLGGSLFAAGRSGFDQIGVRVTGRGHWYRTDDERDGRHNDTVCRGCGHHGHFDYILDYRPCAHPASHQDVASALLARSAVAR